MHLFDRPKIDCHAHIFDPVRFPYLDDTPFRPAGGELGRLEQLDQVMECYGVRQALLVQPNSGYGEDNRYLLQAVREGGSRFKGIAKINHGISLDGLAELKAQGIIGAAVNPTFEGLDFYRPARALVEKLAEQDMFLDLQVQQQDFLMFLPWIAEIPVKVVVDHCARPTPEAGLQQPGFWELLKLADSGRVSVKISGYAKFSRELTPYADTWPYVQALLEAFTPQQCVWGSDWPFLRPPERQDYGPLLKMAERLFGDDQVCQAIFWDTPRRLFGFDQAA